MGFNTAINGFNQTIYTAGNLQGAAATMGSAVYAVDQSFQRMGAVFSGDTYQTSPAAYPVQPAATSIQNQMMGLVSSLLGGGLAGGMTHQQTATALRSFKTEGFGVGIKSLGLSTLKAGGIGAAVGAVISGAKHFTEAARGQTSMAAATGNVAADTVGGLLAGTAGGLGAGIASLGLSALGAPGVAVTIGAVAVGALAGVASNRIYLKSDVRDSIAGHVRGALGGAPYVPPTV